MVFAFVGAFLHSFLGYQGRDLGCWFFHFYPERVCSDSGDVLRLDACLEGESGTGRKWSDDAAGETTRENTRETTGETTGWSID
jgi:hypothetical protein